MQAWQSWAKLDKLAENKNYCPKALKFWIKFYSVSSNKSYC